MRSKGISRNKGEANPFFGKKHTPEALQKMRLIHKGKKRLPRSKEWCQRISQGKKGKTKGKDNHFFGKHHTEETKKIISQKQIENPKFRRFGKENGAWLGGITDKHSKLRNLYRRQLTLWREAVYARDNYTCRSCENRGDRTNPLNAHHIRSFIRYPKLRFDVTNGVTLCVECHKKLRKATILELFLVRVGGQNE